MAKIKMSDISISLSTVFKVFMGVCILVTSVFAAMNYHFAPRHMVEKRIANVEKHVMITDSNVAWIRRVWEEGIKKAEIK